MSLPSPLLAVTDRHGHGRPLRETVRAVLAGGGRWIWFRDRDLPAVERRRLGEDVAEEVRAAGAVLTIGGDVALAVALGAAGVHLPGGSNASAIARARQDLGGKALIGASAHTIAEIETLAAAGIDYVTLSPIFPTASKPGYGPALGLAGIAAAAACGPPVLALGGIAEEILPACRAAGAAGFAVMGGVMRAQNPAEVAERLLTGWGSSGLPADPGAARRLRDDARGKAYVP